jgi:hypothetical protein
MNGLRSQRLCGQMTRRAARAMEGRLACEAVSQWRLPDCPNLGGARLPKDRRSANSRVETFPGAACCPTLDSAKIFPRDHAMDPATVKSGLPDVASRLVRHSLRVSDEGATSEVSDDGAKSGSPPGGGPFGSLAPAKERFAPISGSP